LIDATYLGFYVDGELLAFVGNDGAIVTPIMVLEVATGESFTVAVDDLTVWTLTISDMFQLSPTFGPTPLAPTNTPQPCSVTPLSEPVNIRSTPNTDAFVQGSLAMTQNAFVDGQARDESFVTWWHLANGGWVRSDLVRESGICYSLPQMSS
jgi:hypothetical protein